jgi:hypothetical protein
LRRSLIFATAMMLFVAACSEDKPSAGPVAFQSVIDLSGSPRIGTFEVTTGADVLGCSSGTQVRTRLSETSWSDVMTCESGSNTGTFTIHYSNRALFVWDVRSSSDEFVGLQGEGNWDFSLTGRGSIEETSTGDIEYTP